MQRGEKIRRKKKKKEKEEEGEREKRKPVLKYAATPFGSSSNRTSLSNN